VVQEKSFASGAGLPGCSVSIRKVCKFISFVLENPHKIECVGTKGKVAASALLQRFERVLSGKKSRKRRTFTTTRACNQ
jgi:hypothetical protein